MGDEDGVLAAAAAGGWLPPPERRVERAVAVARVAALRQALELPQAGSGVPPLKIVCIGGACHH